MLLTVSIVEIATLTVDLSIIRIGQAIGTTMVLSFAAFPQQLGRLTNVWMQLCDDCLNIHRVFWVLSGQSKWSWKEYGCTGCWNGRKPNRALRKGIVMRMYPYQSMEKWNVYNGNLLDRKASRELTMLYKRRMEEEMSKGEFVPYRTYFRCSRF